MLDDLALIVTEYYLWIQYTEDSITEMHAGRRHGHEVKFDKHGSHIRRYHNDVPFNMVVGVGEYFDDGSIYFQYCLANNPIVGIEINFMDEYWEFLGQPTSTHYIRYSYYYDGGIRQFIDYDMVGTVLTNKWYKNGQLKSSEMSYRGKTSDTNIYCAESH
jgi:hypothetical protein